MSLDDDTAVKVVSKDAVLQTRGNPSPDRFGVVAFLAATFHRNYTKSAVEARIPSDADMNTADGLARALAAIGLKSRFVLKDVASVDPVALPFVVFRATATPLVVTKLSANKRVATVVDPQAQHLETEMPVKHLKRQIEKGVMLVSLQDDAAGGRMSQQNAVVAPDSGHWFWGPVRANWRNWMQIGVAALLLNTLTLALPLFVMNVYDRVIPNLAYVTLWTLAIGVGIALLLDLVLRTLRGNILENIGRRVDIKVAANLFHQAMHARLLDRSGGAAGITNTIRDFEVVREFFASATFVAVIDLLFIGLFVAALFFVVGPIAWVPLLAVPVVFGLALLAQLPLGKAADRAQQLATKRHAVLIEALGGIETIKSLNAEPLMQKEWEAAVAASSQVNARTRFWSGFAANGTMMVQQAVSVLIIIWGVFLVSDGLITIGGLIAANILAGRVLAPLATIAQTIFRAQYARRSLAALNSFMALPVDQPTTVESDALVKKGSIECRRISFCYPDTAIPALTEVSFEVAAGECVAVLGRVGSGKSTVGKVISGLIPAESGTILVDGIALNQYDLAELRSGIGYLPQSAELFTGSLRENLTIGAPDATDQDIQRAMYFAAMDDFLAAVPEGLDLFIGDQGMRLSGGQRQGVALARLLLRKPKLLFLDEPTNAMDQKMQSQIVERLKELNADGIGLILSTHRQSLASIADRLLVLEQGRVILDGSRDDVLAQLRGLRGKGSE